jgi:ubiquinone/menaquinone biosynthesis C-methylase UbiE
MKSSTWPKIAIKDLNYLEGRRSLFLRATQDALAYFYKKNFEGNEKVLEIGAGTGFMKRNWPKEYRGKWVQLEPQAAFLKEANKRTKNEISVHANVYDIPFESESFDVICGFCSYDVFMDLEKAVKETYRVLKKGGLFFHMIDAYPCKLPIENDFKQLNIPCKITNYLPDSYDYKETPSVSFIAEENSPTKIGLHDYFENKLTQCLLRNFHNSVECNKLIGSFDEEMTEQQKKEKLPETRTFCNNEGSFLQLRDTPKAEKLKKTNPKAYEKISHLEISVIRYIKTRK